MGRKNLTFKQLERRRRLLRWAGIRGSTIRDWLPILIAAAIPILIFLGTRAITLQQADLAEQRAQDEALQAYLDQMSLLVLDRKLLEAEQGDLVYTLAQARTSTVIARLDAKHNQSVIRFLIYTELATTEEYLGPTVTAESSVRLLERIDLHGTQLSEADLSFAAMLGADLSNADLREADLRGADLREADLRGADLRGAVLYEADLSRGEGPYGANLSNADLRGGDLRGADLNHAFLDAADLSDAIGTNNEELEQQAASLEGATMPNGQKYEDWLKSKD